MDRGIATQAPKAQTSLTSSFGVKPKVVEPAKEREDRTSDSKIGVDLDNIAISQPNTPPESPKINLKHNFSLQQRNTLQSDRQKETKEVRTTTLNPKLFAASSSPIQPPNKRVNRSIIARQTIKNSHKRSPNFNSPISRQKATLTRKPISSIASGKLGNPQIQRNTRAVGNNLPSPLIKNDGITPDLQTFIPTSVAEAKQEALGVIAGWANDIPGYYLLRVILGRDPITEEVVSRNSANLIHGVISLIPGGDRLYQNLNETGAIDRGGAWLDKNLAKLNITWKYISSLLGKVWDSLGVSDYIRPSTVFSKIEKVFLPLTSRIINFAKSAGNQLLEFVLEGALKLAGPLATKVIGVLKGAGQLFPKIIKDPIKFINNLVKGLKQGFQGFVGNISTHIKSGLIGWLTGAFGGMNIQIPDDIFSPSGTFSLVSQVLGLTFGYIRHKAVRMFGEKKVLAMEKGVSFFQTLQTGGTNALWDLVKDKMTDLKSMVIDQIENTVVGQVIQAGIKWIIGLLNPAGALLKAGMAIYDIITFFVDRAGQVVELVQAVMKAVKAISQGAVGGAAKLVENALVKALPVAIGFLASLLGINGLAKKVQDIIKRVRGKIDKAIDNLLKKIGKAFKGKKGKGKNGKFTQQDKTKGLAAFEKEEKPFVKNNTITQENAHKVAGIIKQKHPVFKQISVVDGRDSWDYQYIFRSGVVKDTQTKKSKVEDSGNIPNLSTGELVKIHSGKDWTIGDFLELKELHGEKLISVKTKIGKLMKGIKFYNKDKGWKLYSGKTRINYGSLDSLKRPTGIQATLGIPLPKGSGASGTIKPSGFKDGNSGHARGHLLANQLGGSGNEKRNIVTLFQNPVNHPIMSGYEKQVREAVEKGEIVEYKVTPVYEGKDGMPTTIKIEAKGDTEFSLSEPIPNQK